jgi:hypothetical protein
VGHYGYTMHLADAKILHAGPEKAHSLSGYIRYTTDNVFISGTRSEGKWSNAGGMGQSNAPRPHQRRFVSRHSAAFGCKQLLVGGQAFGFCAIFRNRRSPHFR